MAPTPVSPPTTVRPPRSAETDREAGRVRPLPSTEPAPGVPGAAGTTDRECVVTPPARPVPAPERGVPVPARRAAHALVVMALEVVDRRRAPHHTRGAFPPHLAEMLRTLARDGVPGQHLGPARVHRLHIHAADPGRAEPGRSEPGRSEGRTADPGRAPDAEAVDYEVCATYARGPRLFAVAARIRVTPTGAGCVALRLV